MQMSNGDRWNRAIDIPTVAASKSGSLSVINIDSGNPSSQPERNILSLMRYFFQTSISDWHLNPVLVNEVIVFCSTIYIIPIIASRQKHVTFRSTLLLLHIPRSTFPYPAFHILCLFFGRQCITRNIVYIVWTYDRM